MHVLITGASGFVGRHLLVTLLRDSVIEEFHLYCNGIQAFIDSFPSLVSIAREPFLCEYQEVSKSHDNACFIFRLDGREIRVYLYDRDLSKPENCIVPENLSLCYHLASISSVKACEENLAATYAVNVAATELLYKDCVAKGVSKFIFISSGDVYGDLIEEITEVAIPAPNNAYSQSKHKAEVLLYESLQEGTPICIFRPFNHYGPGQSEHFVLSRFTKRLLELKTLGASELTVGNLEAVRNFTSVYDVVALYARLVYVDIDSVSIYNVASSESFRIKGLLDKLIEIVGHSVACVVDPELLRAGENRQRTSLKIDCSKTHRTFAWQPQLSINDGLRLLVDYWANRVG